jgi:hypothetical protein
MLVYRTMRILALALTSRAAPRPHAKLKVTAQIAGTFTLTFPSESFSRGEQSFENEVENRHFVAAGDIHRRRHICQHQI